MRMLRQNPNSPLYHFKFIHPRGGEMVEWNGDVNAMWQFWQEQKRNHILPADMHMLDQDDWVAFPAAWHLGNLMEALMNHDKDALYFEKVVREEGKPPYAIFANVTRTAKVWLDDDVRPTLIQFEYPKLNTVYRIEVVENFR